MTNENYILVSLEDEKSKSIAEVLSSSTCKKIISHLTENKEASEKDLSNALKIPLNTIEYNLKKLISTGFVQKTKNFFWSKKGKKIVMYELSKKSVIISHKKSISNKIKSILPAFILTAAGTFALWTYERIKIIPRNLSKTENSFLAIEESSKTIHPQDLISPIGNPIWLWFLIGALISISIISIINWRKL